jgi:hypothetical protein
MIVIARYLGAWGLKGHLAFKAALLSTLLGAARFRSLMSLGIDCLSPVRQLGHAECELEGKRRESHFKQIAKVLPDVRSSN